MRNFDLSRCLSTLYVSVLAKNEIVDGIIDMIEDLV